MPTKPEQLKQDKRGLWERPELRRIAANNAEGGSLFVDDGNCTGTSPAPQHSGCLQPG
jgi:hypothetical protein